MSDATLELGDVKSLTSIALLFAFESLKHMSETALRQGNERQSRVFYEKWREVEEEVKRRELLASFEHLKHHDLKGTQHAGQFKN